MKKFSKLLSFILILSTLMTSFCISPAFAASQIKKGTTRIVIDDHEANKCEDVVVYNNKRYLPADLYALTLYDLGVSDDTTFTVYESIYKASNNSITVLCKPSGYITFWAGSKDVTFLKINYPSYLLNAPVFYDKQAYISLEDITRALDATTDSKWTSSFDVPNNTIHLNIKP